MALQHSGGDGVSGIERQTLVDIRLDQPCARAVKNGVETDERVGSRTASRDGHAQCQVHNDGGATLQVARCIVMHCNKWIERLIGRGVHHRNGLNSGTELTREMVAQSACLPRRQDEQKQPAPTPGVRGDSER